MPLQPVLPGDSGEIEKIIGGLRIVWMRAFNRGDWETVAGLYAPEAVLLPPNGIAARGIEAVRIALQQMVAAGFRGVQLDDEQVEYSGGLAVETGRYSMRVPAKDARRTTLKDAQQDAQADAPGIHSQVAQQSGFAGRGAEQPDSAGSRDSGKFVSTWRRQANGEFKITVSVWTSESK